jgi:hypothetical protein
MSRDRLTIGDDISKPPPEGEAVARSAAADTPPAGEVKKCSRMSVSEMRERSSGANAAPDFAAAQSGLRLLSRRAAQQVALLHVHIERDRVEIKAVRLGQHTVVAAYIPST